MAITQFVTANNVNTQLAAAASSTATTLTLASSSNLPTLTTGQAMPLTLNDAATGQNYEIVYVTAITGVTLTVVRGQEGTGALNWSVGDYAFCPPTAGTTATALGSPSNTFQVAAATVANQAPQLGQVQSGAATYAVDTGTANTYTVAFTPAITAVTDGLKLRFKAKTANTGASTFSPNGLTATPIWGAAHSALQGGEIVANGDIEVVWNSSLNGTGAWVLLEETGGALQIPPATASQHAVQLGQVGHGQCRLSVTNGTTLTLSPYNGNNLIINGVPQKIPSAGVTLSNSGLAASTVYYVYAFMNAGTMTLEAVTVTHVTGINGVEQKSGDATRTFVGMINTSTSAQFIDAATNRFCLNWFNRRSLQGNITLSSGFNFTNTSSAELSTGMRVNFLSWADEGAFLAVDGEMANNTAGQLVAGLVYMDGVILGPQSAGSIGSTGYGMPFASSGTITPTEGVHSAQLWGFTSGGTATLLNAQTKVFFRG